MAKTGGRNSSAEKIEIGATVNKQNLIKLFKEKFLKFKISGITKGCESEVLQVINTNLDSYLKNMMEELIKISRTKNLNFNMFNKLTEKNPIVKINAYNLEKPSAESANNPFNTYPNFQLYKEFYVCFPQDNNNINRLDKFEELNACKVKYEKISNIKNKIDEIATNKEKDKEKLSTSNPNAKTKIRKVYFICNELER